ncbi:MAG: DnaJ domain-containing protein, partial [Armatimonadetes bacterium]|nr:DnaJ domain-containing protein [Armatimonadota bacterium]
MSFDPYQVLGEEREVSFEVLKASYRRLVRDNHPDVAPDKTAATIRMAQINQAWRLVGDPQKRAEFDSRARLAEIESQNQARQARESAQRARSTPQKSPPRAKPAVPQSRAATREKSARRQKSTSRTKVARHNASPMREMRLVHQISLASQLFHRERKVKEATALCRAVLLADGRNVAARELMGDIFAYQGLFDYALMMFDQALQIAPDDAMLRRKRDRLEIAHSQSNAAPHPEKSTRPSLWHRLRA